MIAKIMRDVGLYSPHTDLEDIELTVPKLLRLAKTPETQKPSAKPTLEQRVLKLEELTRNLLAQSRQAHPEEPGPGYVSSTT